MVVVDELLGYRKTLVDFCRPCGEDNRRVSPVSLKRKDSGIPDPGRRLTSFPHEELIFPPIGEDDPQQGIGDGNLIEAPVAIEVSPKGIGDDTWVDVFFNNLDRIAFMFRINWPLSRRARSSH